MKRIVWLLGLCAGAAIALAGCDTGSYGDLSCDGSYVPECLDNDHYMKCQNEQLTVVGCGEGKYCTSVGDVSVACVDMLENTAVQVCEAGTKQCNGAYVQACVDNAWVNAGNPCPGGCSMGECIQGGGRIPHPRTRRILAPDPSKRMSQSVQGCGMDYGP